MKRRLQRPRAAVQIERPGRLERALWLTLAALVALLPVIYVPMAHDLFRLPKALLFRAGVIALLALATLLALQRRPAVDRRDRPLLLVVAATLAWTAIAALASDNRPLSMRALATTAAYAIVLITAVILLRRRPLGALLVAFSPAAVNAILVMLQERGWQPLAIERFGWDPHLESTGLMGNPNGVGMLLTGPTLAAAAAAFAARGRARAAAALLTAVLAGGLIASRTLTATAALVAGLACLLLLASWKRALIGLAAMAVALLVLFSTWAPLADRAQRLRDLASRGEYNTLLTNRLTPFAAAWEMFRDDPLTGLGPGTFAWYYFDYKIAVDEKYPDLVTDVQRQSWSYNFGEVHNDHLEILAESGVPGYLLFLASLGFLGAVSFRIEPDATDARARFARVLAAPLAAAFAVLALAQFPLQLPAVAVTHLFLAACCIAWRTADG